MMTKSKQAGAALVILLGSAAPLAAEGFSLSYGATVTTNYVSRGANQSTDGRAAPAFQPYVEVDVNGFYAGIWASHVRFSPDRYEIDLYAGYRWEMGGTSLDVGYARYFYNRSGDAGGELYLLAEREIGPATLSGGLYLDPSSSFDLTDVHLGVSFGIVDQLSASAQIGAGPGVRYGNVGLTYAVTDNFEVDARVHTGAGQGGRFVLSASLNF